MPTLKTRGTLKIFIAKSFEKDGETVEYNRAFFLVEDENGEPDVLIVNTKKDISGSIDVDGELSVRVGQNGKMQLVAFETE